MYVYSASGGDVHSIIMNMAESELRGADADLNLEAAPARDVGWYQPGTSGYSAGRASVGSIETALRGKRSDQVQSKPLIECCRIVRIAKSLEILESTVAPSLMKCICGSPRRSRWGRRRFRWPHVRRVPRCRPGYPASSARAQRAGPGAPMQPSASWRGLR